MDFLSFIKNKQMLSENLKIMNEAFRAEDFDKAQKHILSVFRKQIKVGDVIFTGDIDMKIGSNNAICFTYMVMKGYDLKGAFSINYIQKSGAHVATPYSVAIYDKDNAESLFFGDEDEKVKANLVIDMLGASIVFYIPVITSVINSGKFDLTQEDAIKYGRKVFDTKNECVTWDFWNGEYEYQVYENMPDEKVQENFFLANGCKYKLVNGDYQWVAEAEDSELVTHKKQMKKKLNDLWASGEGSSDEFKSLNKEYRVILDAVKGGAKTMDDLESFRSMRDANLAKNKMNITRNVNVQMNISGAKEASNEIKRHKSDPDTAFKQMSMYVKMVIKGTQPAVILCGAPGVGKTYRVLQQLKAAGYTMDGDNMIKGKCSARQLYLTLYNNKGKDDIVVIDDADGLVGPKAPEECINILKAALDSTASDEGRLVSYKVSGEIKDDEGDPIPKYFYSNAGLIVITNYSVGQIDSALRNRAFTQSLDFDPSDLLKIVRNIMPNIEKNKLSMDAKNKAMEYLEGIVEEGKPIEVSIRSFITCARIYQNADSDEEIKLAKQMIEEQMRNMAAKRGTHF